MGVVPPRRLRLIVVQGIFPEKEAVATEEGLREVVSSRKVAYSSRAETYDGANDVAETTWDAKPSSNH